MVQVAMTQFSNLSFVSVIDGETCFWSPDRAGDYDTKNARGRGYAEELLRFMRRERNPVIFGSIVRAITASGIYEGVEIGFCHALGVDLAGV